MNLSDHMKGLKASRKEMLFSELHSLLEAGLDFTRSFRLLTESESDAKTKQLLQELYAYVVEGHYLWESLRQSSRFTALDYGVVRIGEETGNITEALDFLSIYYRKQIAQRRMISGAVSYPLIILVTAGIVLIFMVVVIVPMFEQVYARMGGELPGLTRQMIAFSRHFPGILAVLAGLLLAGTCFFRFYGHTDRVQSVITGVVMKLPVVGTAVRKNQEARFCQLMWLLYHSGIPLLRSVEMLRDILTFYPYRQSFDTLCRELREGGLFADSLSRYPSLYDRKLCALLRVGEETNHLSEMLRRQSEELTRDLEYQLKQLGNLLEPVLILGVGGLVAIVLIAMYLPMFRLGGVIG